MSEALKKVNDVLDAGEEKRQQEKAKLAVAKQMKKEKQPLIDIHNKSEENKQKPQTPAGARRKSPPKGRHHKGSSHKVGS